GSRPAAAAVEHFFENVTEHRAEVEALGIEAARPAGTLAALECRRTVAVVGRTLVGILQDVVGVIEFLELLLGVLVAIVAIRMMLHGELAKGLLDVVGARRPTDAQHLVVVLRHDPLRFPASAIRLRNRPPAGAGGRTVLSGPGCLSCPSPSSCSCR